MKEFDGWFEQIEPERLARDECRSYIGKASGECWTYSIGLGNVILVERYMYLGSLFKADIHAYDFDGDKKSEILKWDLGRNGKFDVIEYDTDGDEITNFALADANINGRFDEDEIYIYQPTTERWQPVVPGALPFPLLPIFPY
jgi:hypothetical protein